jgi:DNA processing protein
MIQPSYVEFSCDELLGPLNAVEQKFAPKRVFVAGNIEILKHGFRVAIVGSRRASREGLRQASELAHLIRERGGIVVSGLAAGIDTAAHSSAIEHGGRTIAVIGTPLNKAYPKENSDLQALIMRDHLCISQFPEGFPTQPGNFPMRNRTMALFSDATVIIEASNTSGSISQGWEALRLGRGLFIAKWLIENPALRWPAKMIDYGAQILSDESTEEFFGTLPERSIALELDALTF